MIPFRVDPSWYERYWWHDSAPRKPGIFAFFRRILSQQRLSRRIEAILTPSARGKIGAASHDRGR